MLDELAIYNLSIKYPNTIDLVREVERTAKAEAIDECIEVFKNIPRHYYREELLNELEQLKEQNK